VSATSIDPWVESPPLLLVRHELGHAFSALAFGAESVVIHHDGFSWSSNPTWPSPPTEEAVMASWLGGLVEPEYCSTNDTIVIGAFPAELKSKVLVRLQSVFEQVRAIDNGKLLDMAIKMSTDGGIQIRREHV
jgi:hypothetical protein